MNHQQVTQYCVVRHGESWYALLSNSVREVMLCPIITPLPNSSRVLKGITHVNNEFLTVTDPLLDSHTTELPKEPSGGRQLLVIDGPDGVWGFLVDEVIALTYLDDFQPHNSSKDHMSFLGTATHLDHELGVVDLNETYRSVSCELKAQWKFGTRDLELSQEVGP